MLIELARQWEQLSAGLEEAAATIARASVNLDWDVRSKAGVDTSINQAKVLAAGLIDQAHETARWLDRKAGEFEASDQAGAVGLNRATASWAGTASPVRSGAPAVDFPHRVVDGYGRLGTVVGTGETPASRPAFVPPEAEDRRALFEFGVDSLVAKLEPLNIAKDLWDMIHIQKWQDQWSMAFANYQVMRSNYGPNALETRAAYGAYLDTAIFGMPFWGTKLRAVVAVLKILGQQNPVY
jgi:hypothetical protein